MTDTPPAEEEDAGPAVPPHITFTVEEVDGIDADHEGLWRTLPASVVVGNLGAVTDDDGTVVAYRCAHPSLGLDDHDLLRLTVEEPAELAEVAKTKGHGEAKRLERRKKALERLEAKPKARREKLRADAGKVDADSETKRKPKPKPVKKAAAKRP